VTADLSGDHDLFALAGDLQKSVGPLHTSIIT
jgi:hypothetical protein